ncbi:MAG: signal recognition particle-docking protein FtsY [Planctomycetota bacterium]
MAEGGFFSRITKGITQTFTRGVTAVGNTVKKWSKTLNKFRLILKEKVYKILVPGRILDQATLDQLEEALISTDMGPRLVTKVIDEVRTAYLDKEIQSVEGIMEFIAAKIHADLPPQDATPRMNPNGPTVILVVGVNGSGKTTSIGKLAWRFKSEGKKVLLGAGDTFRAAAVEQLRLWAEKRLEVDIVTAEQGSHPATVAYNTVAKAVTKGYDVAIIDTAGRLHNQEHLMEELAKVRRSVDKALPGAPHEVLLVIDANQGLNAVQQAKIFTRVVEVSGLILTKLDGTARGGAVLAMRSEVRVPVKWVGLGEKKEDLEPFDAGMFLKGMLDFSEEKTEAVEVEVGEGEDAQAKAQAASKLTGGKVVSQQQIGSKTVEVEAPTAGASARSTPAVPDAPPPSEEDGPPGEDAADTPATPSASAAPAAVLPPSKLVTPVTTPSPAPAQSPATPLAQVPTTAAPSIAANPAQPAEPEKKKTFFGKLFGK